MVTTTINSDSSASPVQPTPAVMAKSRMAVPSLPAADSFEAPPKAVLSEEDIERVVQERAMKIIQGWDFDDRIRWRCVFLGRADLPPVIRDLLAGIGSDPEADDSVFTQGLVLALVFVNGSRWRREAEGLERSTEVSAEPVEAEAPALAVVRARRSEFMTKLHTTRMPDGTAVYGAFRAWLNEGKPEKWRRVAAAFKELPNDATRRQIIVQWHALGLLNERLREFNPINGL